MTEYKTIAESNHFIVLDGYTKESQMAESGRDLLLVAPMPEAEQAAINT